MKTAFKVVFGIAGVLLLLFGIISWKFNSLAAAQFEPREFSIDPFVADGDVELGERIYAVRNGCIDCHGADLSGVEIMDDPVMGTIWGANITPFNLEKWSNNEIARAIRYGVHQSGRSLQFMPAFDYVKLSQSDIGSLIAYLRTVPAVEKPSHKNTFGPLAKLLSSIGKMPVMFSAYAIDQNEGFHDKPEEGPTKDFGEYLAHSCVGCHGLDYTGGPIPGGDPSWPAASNIRLGADSFWTEERFNEMIATGISPKSGLKLKPPMPIELLKQFNEIETKALWLYLSELK